jgi:3-oxoacyl-[acyl-carrier-protein] synthase-3
MNTIPLSALNREENRCNMGSKLVGLDYYLPERVLTNEDLEKEFPDWDSSKIESKIGIRQRHVVSEGETALDLAEKACLKVLANYDKTLIDFVILCTQSPDYFLPTSACILQNRLGLSENIGAYDFNLGCSGYIYGLAQAKGFIAAGIAKNVLVVVAETYSRHMYIKDVANRAIFGDGAAATIISASDTNHIHEFSLGTCGAGYENLIVRNGGMKNPTEETPEEIEYGTQSFYTANHLYMNGPEIFNFTIDYVPKLVENTLAVNKLLLDDVDYFIYHQANKFMLNYLRGKNKIPKEKFYIDMTDTGNIVSATVPVGLKNAIDKGIVVPGQKVMLVGFGVGYSWGATVITI